MERMLSEAECPMVSIVFTAYNAERYIGASVAAALAQTYPNYEVIVVDDGSSDRTGSACQRISDSRFRYLNQGRLGRPKALNCGIQAARGTYIAINDADDLSFPYRLHYAMEFLGRHRTVAFLGTHFVETSVFHESVPDRMLIEAASSVRRGVANWPSRSTVYRKNLFNNSTLVYPKSTWSAVGGYDESLSLCEDYDFYLRAMQCGPAALLPGQTVLWYTNPHGFFKQKSVNEYLPAMALIKQRAWRVLELPWWMRLYHPSWAMSYRLLRWSLPRPSDFSAAKPGNQSREV